MEKKKTGEHLAAKVVCIHQDYLNNDFLLNMNIGKSSCSLKACYAILGKQAYSQAAWQK